MLYQRRGMSVSDSGILVGSSVMAHSGPRQGNATAGVIADGCHPTDSVHGSSGPGTENREQMDEMLSGPWGILVGGVVGVVASVLFEDHLLKTRKRLGRRVTTVRRRLGRSEPAAKTLFEIGPIRTSQLIVEGDGTQVIDEQRVSVMVTHQPVEVPAEIQPWIDEVAQEQAARRQRGEQSFWNGPNYAVEGLVVSRSPLDEFPEVCLRVRESDYFTFLATQQLDRELPGGGTLRSRYLDGQDPLRAPAFLASSFGTNVALVTADQQLIFARRSDEVGSRPGVWSSSANEALSRRLDSDGRSAPELYRVMRRGISEELAIEREEYLLELLAFGVDTELHQWGAFFTGTLRGLTGDEVLERRTRGVADKWESQELKLIPFEIGPVCEFIAAEHAKDNLAPHTPALVHLALVHRYGRRTVEREALRTLRR